MFARLALFFIENSKLTAIAVTVTLFAGILSYIFIPKQYNPSIIVPAFSLEIPLSGQNAEINKNLYLDVLEDAIGEIEQIDHLYGIAGDNFIGLMVQFQVGVKNEDAKIRINQKLREIQNFPENIKIDAIDPEQLPQISFALNMEESSPLSISEQKIYLRNVALSLQDTLRSIPGVSRFEILGGERENIIIDLDISKVQNRSLHIGSIFQSIESQEIQLPSGNIIQNGKKIFIESSGMSEDINKLKKLVIANQEGNPIYLEDIADIRIGESRISQEYRFASKEVSGNAVFVGIAKQKGINAVVFTKKIQDTLSEIEKTLPKNVSLHIIQDEGENAAQATSHLIVDLILSIIIVVAVLILFLGFRNALNTATSIPLILALVFLFAYLNGDNINRITLFALILVIGMLVDDSIVVVENIHRHMEERAFTGKTKVEAILAAVQEVGNGVILSTITKVLSFGAMFSVTGMMGEYMGPIPKYGIMALIFSIFVAFTINPWVSSLTTPDIIQGENHAHKKTPHRFDIRTTYKKIMLSLIENSKKAGKTRKKIRYTFWIGLVLLMIVPISLGVFKARMLPKSNQNQIYLWINAPRDNIAENSETIAKDVEDFLLDSQKRLPEELRIVESVSSSIGGAFLSDFSNLFRGGNMRKNEYEISFRINLQDKHHYSERMFSEAYTIAIRPLLRDYLLQKYPDITLRLLEDPPGPPVRATFLAKIEGNASREERENFSRMLYQKMLPLAQKHDIVDFGISFGSSYPKKEFILDSDALGKTGISSKEISASLGVLLEGQEITPLKNSDGLETNTIILRAKQDNALEQKLENIIFYSQNGEKIPLSSLGKFENSFVSDQIHTDDKQESIYIYGEMGNNSVVYPTVELYSYLSSKEFLGDSYKVSRKNFYEIEFTDLKNGKIYTLVWDGEWKLTMDTFRDLGTAMILAIGLIYLLIVGQFRSFAVAGIIMLPFLLGFYGIFPGFSLLYLLKNEYFNATGMIGIISLAGIVVGNAILLIDYIEILKSRGWTIEKAIVEAGYVRFMPIMLTSLSAILGAIKITSDPVWSGLAWSIVWGLSASALLTLILLPVFYYDSQKKNWE